MNKKSMIMMSLMTLTASVANASSCSATEANCDKAPTIAVSAEEAVFVSKLSEVHCQAFNLMNTDQQHEVLAAAHQGTMAPDAAVDTVLKKHHLALVDGALKTATNVK